MNGPAQGKPALGRLEQLDIKTYWQNEASEFTPWLAQEENLGLLGEAIGLELELVSTEQAVGPFAADIVCKRRADAQKVVIENQIEKTDHTHLGQIITYAAGLHATTVIWIARQFTDEHRAALDWLNEHTPAEVAFFAVTVELWMIGRSAPAPRFNVVARPNVWTKPAAQPSPLTDRDKSMLEYWGELGKVVNDNPGPLRAPAPSTGNSVNFAIGKSGVALAAVINPTNKWIRIEIYLNGGSAKARFDQLYSQKTIADAKISGLEWQRLDGKQDCRIALFKHETDPANRSDWAKQHSWLRDTAKQFDAVFRPLVKQLKDSPPATVSTAGNGVDTSGVEASG
ncbi:MAG: DUF4268 domain-containing protein [Armatimonadetes bacterium]|nr:DUF4268 domain-containing protein [Armatimonadota bacterium]MDE2207399.1 DUF4268 domain-containing protein [Armatimonadota bacterium]